MALYEVTVGGRTRKIEVEPASASSAERAGSGTDWRLRIDGREFPVNCVSIGSDSLSLIVEGDAFEARIESAEDGLKVLIDGKAFDCSVRDPRSLRSRKRAGQHQSGEHKLTASMPGKVVRVLARAGDAVLAGQGIVVIEAMKMQNEVRTPKDGKVKSIIVREGARVNAGEVLAVLE